MRLLVIASPLILLVGCSGPGLNLTTRSGSQTQSQVPINRVLAIWSEAVITADDSAMVQGLACKVYLFGPEADAAVAQQGEFRFYAFEEQPGQAKKDAPDHQWVFTPEDLKQGPIEDPLGWGYKFFLPFDHTSKVDKVCSVAVRYVPDSGRPVLSDFTMVTLPGLKRSDAYRTARTKVKSPATGPSAEAARIAKVDSLQPVAPKW